jgi:hypothetical protein
MRFATEEVEGADIPPTTTRLTTTMSTAMLAVFGVWLTYRLARALYNISPYHSLHQFPGPKLAAMSFLYEFWYDGILWGRYTHEIERMHQKYGTATSGDDARETRLRLG